MKIGHIKTRANQSTLSGFTNTVRANLNRIKRSLSCAALIMILCHAFCLACCAEEMSVDLSCKHESLIQEINDLTKEILLIEIEIQKSNTIFRLESTRQPKLRAWRQFAYSQTNSNMTEAALIGRMALSYPYTKEYSGRPDQRAIQRCAATSMVGQLIAASGETFEVIANLRDYRKASLKARDPKSYRTRVTSSVKELDALIEKRERLIGSAELSPYDLKILKCESTLLKDMRDLALVQYGHYRSGARRLQFFQNAAYLLSISKNLVGATSNLLNIQASRRGDTNCSGYASLLNLVAGTLVVATPVIGRVSGNLAGLADRRLVSKEFADLQASETSAFMRDRLHYSETLKQNNVPPSSANLEKKLAEIFAAEESLLLTQEVNIENERKQAKKTTVENVITGSVVGSSRMAAGILGMVGTWKYPDRRWISSRYTAAACTIYGAGTAFNSLETARVRIAQVRHERKEKERGSMPRQVLQERLAALDAMSQSLTGEGIAVAQTNSRKTH